MYQQPPPQPLNNNKNNNALSYYPQNSVSPPPLQHPIPTHPPIQINRYFNFFTLKYYFKVNNSYVANKIRLLLFPWRHRVREDSLLEKYHI
ncbi:13663_t:CDS:2 [Entrophospora sp. SA101]|nr:13663_t:CDS:2 [Entrophospora sp. SA101]